MNATSLAQTERNSKPLFRASMTNDDVDEMNGTESRALDWQKIARRRPCKFNVRMAKQATIECLTLAAKFDIGTVVQPFEGVAE